MHKQDYKPLQSPDQQRGPVIYCPEHLFPVDEVFGEEHPRAKEHIALRFDADQGWVDLADSFFGRGVHWALVLVSQDPM
jgi:hypothetical protein